MKTSIDYVAFTVPCLPLEGGASEGNLEYLAGVIQRLCANPLQEIVFSEGWQVYQGKGFYTTFIQHDQSKLTIHFGNTNGHAYFECTGQTCAYLRDRGCLEDVLQFHCSRLSRLDIAVDIETDTDVSEFVSNMEGKSFRSRSYITSAQGDTAYIGSRNSERYCRVYRYHAPHPRSAFLRVETVLHGAHAKAACEVLLQDGLERLVGMIDATFRFSHPVWQPTLVEQGKLPSAKSLKTEASLHLWLHKQVQPALLRRAREGSLDLRSWCENLLQMYEDELHDAERRAMSSHKHDGAFRLT